MHFGKICAWKRKQSQVSGTHLPRAKLGLSGSRIRRLLVSPAPQFSVPSFKDSRFDRTDAELLQLFRDCQNPNEQNPVKELPVPFHADLRPKQVDRFIRNYFEQELLQKSNSFNPTMERFSNKFRKYGTKHRVCCL